MAFIGIMNSPMVQMGRWGLIKKRLCFDSRGCVSSSCRFLIRVTEVQVVRVIFIPVEILTGSDRSGADDTEKVDLMSGDSFIRSRETADTTGLKMAICPFTDIAVVSL